MNESYRMSIFDAVAFALAFFHIHSNSRDTAERPSAISPQRHPPHQLHSPDHAT
jgi:hypothetical protein